MSDTGINLTAIMEREGINSIHRKRAGMHRPQDGWYFEVNLCGQVFPGYGETVGKALAHAKQRNALKVAA